MIDSIEDVRELQVRGAFLSYYRILIFYQKQHISTETFGTSRAAP